MLKKMVGDFRVKALIPYEHNAKIHSDEQVAQIANSIIKFGFYNPIIIDEMGVIIAGHGRRLAAIKLKMSSVPAIVISDLTEAERRAIRLADNKISDHGSWDFDKVRDELAYLLDLDYDVFDTGFRDFEIDAILKADPIIPDQELQPRHKKSPKKAYPEPEDSVSDSVDQSKKKRVKKQDLAEPDLYSVFELTMLSENKQRLVEVLDDIISDNFLTSIEEALMVLVKMYEG